MADRPAGADQVCRDHRLAVARARARGSLPTRTLPAAGTAAHPCRRRRRRTRRRSRRPSGCASSGRWRARPARRSAPFPASRRSSPCAGRAGSRACPADSCAGRPSGRVDETLERTSVPAPGRITIAFQPTRPGKVWSLTRTRCGVAGPRRVSHSSTRVSGSPPCPGGWVRLVAAGRKLQRRRAAVDGQGEMRAHLGALACEDRSRSIGRAPGTSGSRPGRGCSGGRRGCVEIRTSTRWLIEKLPSGCACAPGAACAGTGTIASTRESAVADQRSSGRLMAAISSARRASGAYSGENRGFSASDRVR